MTEDEIYMSIYHFFTYTLWILVLTIGIIIFQCKQFVKFISGWLRLYHGKHRTSNPTIIDPIKLLKIMINYHNVYIDSIILKSQKVLIYYTVLNTITFLIRFAVPAFTILTFESIKYSIYLIHTKIIKILAK